MIDRNKLIPEERLRTIGHEAYRDECGLTHPPLVLLAFLEGKHLGHATTTNTWRLRFLGWCINQDIARTKQKV